MACFVYAKIPLQPGWAERLPGLYEAVERALSAAALGSLIGWGRSVSDPRGRGVDAVTHQRLDIEVSDLAPGLALLKDTLAALGVPAGSELHYTEDGRSLQMAYAASGWAGPSASSAAHRPRGR